MKVGKIDTNKKVLVVAEIGNNHEGSFKTAVKMIQSAARCGVDAVKFQTFKTEQFVNPENSLRFQKLKSFELTFSEFEKLRRITREEGLLFISTPLDMESARFLKKMVEGVELPILE